MPLNRSLNRRQFLGAMALGSAAVMVASKAHAAPPGSAAAPGNGWMSLIPDSTTVDDLTIPGTHNSCARIGGPFDTAKCQDPALPELFGIGVRFIDIRCRLIDDGFAIHHGPIYQQKNFSDVMTDCRGFLSTNPGETIIMSVQQEYSNADAAEFAAVFNDRYMKQEGFGDIVFRDRRIPALGDVRGKVILIANQDGIGGIPAGAGDLVAYQNDWEAPTARKWELITAHLQASADSHPADGRLFVNYTSTTTGELIPNPRNYATELNPKTTQYARDAGAQGQRPIYGAVVVDFAGSVASDLVPALIDCNSTLHR